MNVLSPLKKRLGKGGFIRSVATLTLGTALAQAMTVAAMPLLTRLYTPTDFGFLAVFFAIAGVVATLVTLRYETAVLPAKTDQEAATVVLLCLVSITLFTILLLGISALLPENTLHLLSIESRMMHWLPIVVLTGASIAIIATAQAWLNRHKKYEHMAVLRIAQSIAIVGLSLLFGTALKQEQGLLLAQILAYLLTASLTLWLARSAGLHWEKSELNPVAQRHSNAPKYLLLTALLDTATLQLPVVLIANWFGQDAAGQFSMAWRILMLPMGLVGTAIGQVFLQRFSQASMDTLPAQQLLTKTWRFLFIIGLIPMLATFFYGEQIFAWALGDTWRNAGLLASTLAPMLLAMFVSSPTSATYVVLGLQRYSLFFGLIVFLYRPILLYWGYKNENFVNSIQAWVFFEIITITTYQLIALKKIKSISIKQLTNDSRKKIN